jgi:hypothetical protein
MIKEGMGDVGDLSRNMNVMQKGKNRMLYMYLSNPKGVKLPKLWKKESIDYNGLGGTVEYNIKVRRVLEEINT